MIMKNGDLKSQYDPGMIGLGFMGRNLLLNMSDHGFPVAGYDKDPDGIEYGIMWTSQSAMELQVPIPDTDI